MWTYKGSISPMTRKSDNPSRKGLRSRVWRYSFVVISLVWLALTMWPGGAPGWMDHTVRGGIGVVLLVFCAWWLIQSWAEDRAKERVMRRIAGGHCAECGYELRGNASGTCPECGNHFEPDTAVSESEELELTPFRSIGKRTIAVSSTTRRPWVNALTWATLIVSLGLSTFVRPSAGVCFGAVAMLLLYNIAARRGDQTATPPESCAICGQNLTDDASRTCQECGSVRAIPRVPLETRAMQLDYQPKGDANKEEVEPRWPLIVLTALVFLVIGGGVVFWLATHWSWG
jgi:predicted Zn-ribbon and HTH transcriptional regulator